MNIIETLQHVADLTGDNRPMIARSEHFHLVADDSRWNVRMSESYTIVAGPPGEYISGVGNSLAAALNNFARELLEKGGQTKPVEPVQST